jgi:hypothetical protein
MGMDLRQRADPYVVRNQQGWYELAALIEPTWTACHSVGRQAIGGRDFAANRAQKVLKFAQASWHRRIVTLMRAL